MNRIRDAQHAQELTQIVAGTVIKQRRTLLLDVEQSDEREKGKHAPIANRRLQHQVRAPRTLAQISQSRRP